MEGLKDSGINNLSNYQFTMIKNILEPKWPIIAVLTSPTGSGKTLIFTLISIIHSIIGKITCEQNPTVLIIYPRKALARDQLQRMTKILYYINKKLIENNVTDCNNSQVYISIGILDGDSPRDDKAKTLKELEGKTIRGITIDAGLPVTCKYKKVGNKLTSTCIDKERRELPYNLVTDARREIREHPPSILITNRSMLEYHLNPLLEKRQYSEIFLRPGLIILDEAHAYNGFEKTFTANLLHRLYLEKTRGDLNKLREKAHRLAIILSSATITTVHKHTSSNSIDLFRKDVQKFAESLLPYKIFELFNKWRNGNPIITEPYETLEKGSAKIQRRNFVLILMPRPENAASTLMQEALLATLEWSLSQRLGRAHKLWQFIAFFDNKDDLERINEWLQEVIIKNRCEHCDRLGVPDERVIINNNTYCPTNTNRNIIKEEWRNYIKDILNLDNLDKLTSDYYENNPDALHKLVNHHELWASFATVIDEKTPKAKIKRLIIETCKYDKHVGMHHADLDRATREIIENKLKNNNLLGLLSTQTLELGIDMSDISIILQYKPPRKAENFTQRLGRAGRSKNSLYTALGVLVLSHIDVPYLSEEFARKRLFEVRPVDPPYKNMNLLLTLVIKYLVFLAHLKKDKKTLDLFKILIGILDSSYNTRNIRVINLESQLRNLSQYREEVIKLLKDLINNKIQEETLNSVYNTLIEELQRLLSPTIQVEEAKSIENALEKIKSKLKDMKNNCINHIQNSNKYEENIINGLVGRIIKLFQIIYKNLSHIEDIAKKCAAGVGVNISQSACEDIRRFYSLINKCADDLDVLLKSNIFKYYGYKSNLCNIVNDGLFLALENFENNYCNELYNFIDKIKKELYCEKGGGLRIG